MGLRGKIGEHHDKLFMGSNDSMVQSFIEENNSETEVPWFLFGKWPINKLCTPRKLDWKSISDKCVKWKIWGKVKCPTDKVTENWRGGGRWMASNWMKSRIKEERHHRSKPRYQFEITLDGRVNPKRSLKNHVPPVWSSHPGWKRY